MLMSSLLNMPMPVLPLDLSRYFTVCTASKVEIFMLDLLVSVRSFSVNYISHETTGGLYQWPMKDGNSCVTDLSLGLTSCLLFCRSHSAYQSVLLSLLIYFICIGVYVVQFNILILSRPISSHPFFYTSCYLIFKQKVTLNLHGNSSRGFGKIIWFIASFIIHSKIYNFLDLLPDSTVKRAT